MEDDSLTIWPPIYMFGMKIRCWKCEERMPVVALLAPTVGGAEDQVCVLSDIVVLPEDLLIVFKKIYLEKLANFQVPVKPEKF